MWKADPTLCGPKRCAAQIESRAAKDGAPGLIQGRKGWGTHVGQQDNSPLNFIRFFAGVLTYANI